MASCLELHFAKKKSKTKMAREASRATDYKEAVGTNSD
jgi:hypothetical protein